MTPQAVVIHGVRCVLQDTGNGGGSLIAYRVTEPKSGAVLAQEASRLLAVARAAETLRTQRTQ